MQPIRMVVVGILGCVLGEENPCARDSDFMILFPLFCWDASLRCTHTFGEGPCFLSVPPVLVARGRAGNYKNRCGGWGGGGETLLGTPNLAEYL